MNECNFPTCGCQNVYGAPWCKACLSIMSPPKPHEPAEIMRDKTAQIDEFKKSLVESSGYFTWADTENHRKEFGGSRITACGVTYEYGTHPLAAMAMRERAADKAVRKMKFYEKKSTHEPTSYHAFDECSTALGYFAQELRKLPTTFTDAELLAAAMQLPEVRALVEAADDLNEAISATNKFGDRSLTITGPTANLKWLINAEDDARAAIAPFRKETNDNRKTT